MKGYAYSKDVLSEACRLELEDTEDAQEPLLSTEQQLALMELIRVDDPELKLQVIGHNLRLVFNIAKRYSDHGAAIFDLVREGNHGLIHALKSFDLEGGFRFAAYARQCIRQSIERTILKRKDHVSFAAFQNTPFHGV